MKVGIAMYTTVHVTIHATFARVRAAAVMGSVAASLGISIGGLNSRPTSATAYMHAPARTTTSHGVGSAGVAMPMIARTRKHSAPSANAIG